MNKSLMISIQPQHAVNILNGKKTLELRTWIPKGYVGWVYVYVTKGKKDILYKYKDKYYTQHYLTFTDSVEVLNSKVAFRFWFDEYIKLEWVDMTLNHNPIDRIYNYHALVKNVYNNVEWILPKLCLRKQHVIAYGKERDLYAWYIKKLEIFDKPKELSEFESRTPYKNNDGRVVAWGHSPIIRAPQKMQWVYVKER